MLDWDLCPHMQASRLPPSCRHAEFQVALSLSLPLTAAGRDIVFARFPPLREGVKVDPPLSFYPVKDSLFNMAMTFWGGEVGKKKFVLEQRL